MNKKLTKDDAVKRAAQDFKTLIIYYNVTRPQRLPYFKKDGKFSIKEFKRQINFGGKSMDEIRRMNLNGIQFKNFMACQAHYNYTFGIPTERVKKILSSYRDEFGKTHYIHISDVLPIVEADIGTIEHKPHGEAWGKYSFCGKWLMDDKIRDNYLKDKKWSNIFTAPISKRFKEYIEEWIESDKKYYIKHTEEKDMTTVDEEKEAFINEASHAEPTPEVDVHIEENQDDIYADIPPEQPKQEVKVEAIKIEEKPVVEVQKVEIPEEPKQIKQLTSMQLTSMQLTSIQKMRLDNYIERVKDKVLSKETFGKYLKEEFGNVIEEAIEYIRANIRG